MKHTTSVRAHLRKGKPVRQHTRMTELVEASTYLSNAVREIGLAKLNTLGRRYQVSTGDALVRMALKKKR